MRYTPTRPLRPAWYSERQRRDCTWHAESKFAYVRLQQQNPRKSPSPQKHSSKPKIYLLELGVVGELHELRRSPVELHQRIIPRVVVDLYTTSHERHTNAHKKNRRIQKGGGFQEGGWTRHRVLTRAHGGRVWASPQGNRLDNRRTHPTKKMTQKTRQTRSNGSSPTRPLKYFLVMLLAPPNVSTSILSLCLKGFGWTIKNGQEQAEQKDVGAMPSCRLFTVEQETRKYPRPVVHSPVDRNQARFVWV